MSSPSPAAKPVLVVAGDVCIDWLSIPVASVMPVKEDPQPTTAKDAPHPMNWQLRSGLHMYARRGGAWLTADFLEAAMEDAATVIKPQTLDKLQNVAPDEVIHSMLALQPCRRDREDKEVSHWVVERFDGYAGPPPEKVKELRFLPPEPAKDSAKASLLLLDDAGNGFRNQSAAWPKALSRDRRPLILYKVRRPLGVGDLWKRIEADHLDRTIALLSASELRGEGAPVSHRLSWERTATDLVLALAREPRFDALRRCPFLIVPLDIEGAVLVRCVGNRVCSARLWYVPNRTEGELSGPPRGYMSGLGSAFAAAVAASLAEHAGAALDPAALEPELGRGIRRGLRMAHRLLEEGFGPCGSPDRPRPPEYPMASLFDEAAWEMRPREQLCEVPLPDLPDLPKENHKLPAYRTWRILDSQRNTVFAELAAVVARRGVKEVFRHVPVGKFGGLETVDRTEIESYRSIRNLMREYLRDPRQAQPLCVTVFGPPGSGKSFGVHQVARSISSDIEKLDFNVSQWDTAEYLPKALHRVRDYALRGKVPLVFFDEFDAQVDSQRYGWLKYFLAPMQDGVFFDGLHTHQIGKAIFVFAGGTAFTFAEFHRKATEASEEVRGLKLPDFLSRLRGNVDVFGLDPAPDTEVMPLDTHLIRRALILRHGLREKESRLEDATGTLQIHDAVLRAFLFVPRYFHGARSLRAIVEMSNLIGRDFFDPSLLPPPQQLKLHVDAEKFMGLVERHQVLGDRLERIARAIHQVYLDAALGEPGVKIGDRPALRPWDELSPLFKNSNRDQAASYPGLLAAVGCEFEEGADPDFRFREDQEKNEVETLARLEHGRWVEERCIKQPDHPLLEPWEKLPEKEKEKDRRTVRAIPRILSLVDLKVRRADGTAPVAAAPPPAPAR
jgi:hypothetical protein